MKASDPAPTAGFGRLDQRVAVVTGSSSGLGRAIAWELASAGADVLVHARANQQAASEVVQRILELGSHSDYLLCDLADSATHEPLVQQAWDWRGQIDIWVNNAGADVLTGPASHWTFEEKLQQLWQVDVVATLCLSRLVGRRMQQRAAQKGTTGVILNMGWDQAEWGMAGDSGELFGTIKGAVIASTKSLARSLAPQVRVNCLAPGWIKTAWGEQADPYWQQRAVQESLRGRWGTPDDVAKAARYLASPAADFITGQTIHVNGGFRHSE